MTETKKREWIIKMPEGWAPNNCSACDLGYDVDGPCDGMACILRNAIPVAQTGDIKGANIDFGPRIGIDPAQKDGDTGAFCFAFVGTTSEEAEANALKWLKEKCASAIRPQEQVLAHGHVEAVKWIFTDKVKPGYNFSNGQHGTLVWIPSDKQEGK